MFQENLSKHNGTAINELKPFKKGEVGGGGVRTMIILSFQKIRYTER